MHWRNLYKDNEDTPHWKAWLVRRHLLHVNHWWGVTIKSWHVFWRAGKLEITRDFPHTEN